MTIGVKFLAMTEMREYRGTKEFYLALKKCLDAAQAGEKIHYKDIAEVIPEVPPQGNYMQRETAAMTGAISSEMDERGHPMLSAVVVRVNKRGPGQGFYTLAYDYLDKLDEDPETMTEDEKLAFWEKELQKVYDHWQ